MSKLVFLFVCVAVFHLANALQCYHCEKENCEKDMSTWQKSQCAPAAIATQEPACLKFVYKDATNQKETSSRKCIFQEKNTKYSCETGKGEQIICETCKSDLCNSAPVVHLSLAAVSGVFLALFVPKLFA